MTIYPEDAGSVCVSSPENVSLDSTTPTLSGIVELALPVGARTKRFSRVLRAES